MTVLLIGSLILPGCSSFTRSGRKQAAYQRYVKKTARAQDRRRAKLAKQERRVPAHHPSEYRMNSGIVSSPESVSSGEPPSGQ